MLPPDPSTYPSITPPSLLLVILDLHPLSWSLLATPPPANHLDVPETAPSGQSRLIGKAQPTALAASQFITMLLVFLNAHLASRWGNRVVVYGATGGRSRLLYPPPANEAGPSKPKPNTYLPFQLLDSRLEQSLREMAAEEEERARETEGNGLNAPPALVSALAKALCYINRQHPESTATHALSSSDAKTSGTGPEQLETRILVINATPGSGASQEAGTSGENGAGAGGAENPNSDKGADDRTDKSKGKGKGDAGMRGGYVGLMNCVFAAQKAKLPIDVLTLPPPGGGTAPPIFLQQAAHLTEGIYWRWNGRGGLLQYLHAIYLPPPSLRKTPFAVPPQDAVDFRAVCFCHHDVVDVGFVCSVCLSIFCKPLPYCLMCKTKFPIKSLPTLKALAANIEPIPVPNTIPPPREQPGKPRHQDGAKGKSKEGKDEPIVVE